MGRIRNLEKRIAEKCRCPNNNLFITALLSIIVFLLVEVGARSYNLYNTIPNIDIPTHFFGGIALFIGILWIVSLSQVKYKRLAALVYTLAGAITWEIIETLEELVIYNPPYLRDIFFWDGVGDIIITMLGGIFGMFIIYLIKNKTHILHEVEI
ncbi:hypothetical protein KY332_04765 [Candidatus Woesearchaeota archaeon]|nr:hypothetical protein [Candidatus Woesearchaeota archaeon]